ncbi:MAG: hypothetical protein WAW23_08415 [Candidatus Methanoperedens sp.]
MAMIIRVKELVHESSPDNEYPVPVMRTKGIYKVPDDFDYGAICDDRNSAEVIAEHVPDDVIIGTWDMPKPKLILKDEKELSGITGFLNAIEYIKENEGKKAIAIEKNTVNVLSINEKKDLKYMYYDRETASGDGYIISHPEESTRLFELNWLIV